MEPGEGKGRVREDAAPGTVGAESVPPAPLDGGARSRDATPPRDQAQRRRAEKTTRRPPTAHGT